MIHGLDARGDAGTEVPVETGGITEQVPQANDAGGVPSAKRPAEALGAESMCPMSVTLEVFHELLDRLKLAAF